MLTSEEARSFATLSLVSELDVAEHAAGFLDRHGSYLRRLVADRAPTGRTTLEEEAQRVLDGPGASI